MEQGPAKKPKTVVAEEASSINSQNSSETVATGVVVVQNVSTGAEQNTTPNKSNVTPDALAVQVDQMPNT